jgi:F0F1-type ATP synthase membrane subunit a
MKTKFKVILSSISSIGLSGLIYIKSFRQTNTDVVLNQLNINNPSDLTNMSNYGIIWSLVIIFVMIINIYIWAKKSPEVVKSKKQINPFDFTVREKEV